MEKERKIEKERKKESERETKVCVFVFESETIRQKTRENL